MVDATNVKITDGVTALSLTGGMLPVSSTVQNVVGIFDTKAPGIRGSYIFSTPDLPGVVAANNFVTLSNPTGSGHTIFVLGVFISTYNAGAALNVKNSMQGSRFAYSTISGGTIQAASTYAAFDNTFPASIAEVRTGGPTVTLGPNAFNSPPPISSTAGQYVHSVGYGASTAGGPFVLAAGEGLVLRTAAGATGQNWNISLTWLEI